MEDLILKHKTLYEVSKFLGVSISTVSESLDRSTPSRVITSSNEWQKLKDSITLIEDGYTIKDMQYIKEHDKSYFKYLQSNDYINNEDKYQHTGKRSLEPSELEIAIQKTKDKCLQYK